METENNHSAIFFDDLKEEAQRRLIEEEFLMTFDEEEVTIVAVSIDPDLYGYDEDPTKQTLEQHIHALLITADGEHSWLMVWNCIDKEFDTIMKEAQQ